MRRAAIASIGVHFGLIAGAFVFLNLEAAIDETAAESVSVDIISMEMVSTDPSEDVTETTETLVSTGAEVEAQEVPETADAEPAKAVQELAEAVTVAEIEPPKSEEIASAEVLTAAPDLNAPVKAAIPQIVDASAALKPVETASLAPVEGEELQVAPIPKPRIVRKPVEAKVEPTKEQPREQPAEKPKKAGKPAGKKKKPPSKQASLGNGGTAEADAAASKKAGGGQGKKNDGGSAAASKYPGLVQAKVTRAAKYPSKAKGEDGEALVSFTVGAGGKVMKVALARSSGNDALDDAALAAVDRAAPFPPIPEAAGRSTWSFDVPVYFKK